MATRQTSSERLVRRCNDAGWPAERGNDGWKIMTPQGSYPLHLTYSDHRALINATKDLERFGLAEAEKQNKDRKQKERREKIIADRAAAAKKTAVIAARQQHAVARAAGPYLAEAEDCDLAWLTTPHPAPWMRWMTITAKAARTLLDDHNDDNRHITADATGRYAQIIASGQWHLTHQGLAIDTRGTLQDGQHRLKAIVEAAEALDEPDLAVPFAVFVGMPVENFKTIDEGRLRTAAQMLRKDGLVSAGHLSTCVRVVAGYRSGNPRRFLRDYRTPIAAVYDQFEQNPERFQEAVTWAVRNYVRTDVTPGTGGAARYLLYEANGWDNPYVTAFLEGFCWQRKYNTAFVLPDDDPRKVLRSKIPPRSSKKRPRPIELVGWFITSWNNLVLGNHPSSLRFNENSPIPQILTCLPGQGVAPRALLGEVDS